MENNSYFVASRHKLSPFFSLIFRFSSCHHPLLASALSKVIQDEENRAFVSKDENALRQLISMISSDNRHVVCCGKNPYKLHCVWSSIIWLGSLSIFYWQVEQASFALSSLAADVTLAMQLIKSDIMQPIEIVLKTAAPEEVIYVLQVVVNLAFASDTVAQKMLSRDILKSLKSLCAHKNPEASSLAVLVLNFHGLFIIKFCH